MHAWGLRLRGVLRMLAIAHPSVLPSAMRNDVGTPVAIISQLNTQPACAPVNTSPAALRLPTHDSGPGWLATPFLCDSFIHDSTPHLRSCDLIVSAMGDWTAEGGLNAWHLAERRRMRIVYGWTEAHACAGHAVAIGPEGGCFACGFGNDGRPLLRVTDWPRSALQAEPACGAVYQPFGPVELTHIEGLIAEVALDCLLGRSSIKSVSSLMCGPPLGRRSDRSNDTHCSIRGT